MTFTTTMAGGNSNYTKYVDENKLVKTDSKNNPTLLDFTLINYDGSMVPLVRGAYITLTSTFFGGVWYSGYVTNSPTAVYLGSKNGLPQWAYTYQATSEEYLLNNKPLGILPPFLNMYQGQILTKIISYLSPANFVMDVTNVQLGQFLPRYVVDPNKHFSDVVSDFAGPANYRFYCRAMHAYYLPQDSVTGLTLDGNSHHFTPSGLVLQPSTDPIINDAVVLGDIEPQTYYKEYFVGDGATATFPLASNVFGTDSALFLDDDFSGSSIDNTKWTLYDSTGTALVMSNGYMNAVGGGGSAYDVHLDSANLIPLEGSLRMTHGQIDFAGPSDGVIGSLWQTNVSSAFSNCIYGVRCQISGSDTLLNPMIGGSVDSTQGLRVDYTKRYVIRTIMQASQLFRTSANYSYRDAAGVVHQVGGTGVSDTATFQTIVTEIDPTNANITRQESWSNTGTLPVSYGLYVSVVAGNMDMSVSGVTISSPMQVGLSESTFALPPIPTGTCGITATPNPIPVGTGTIVLNWSAPRHSLVDIYVIPYPGATQTLVAGGEPSSGSYSGVTWATPGNEFILVDHATSAQLANLTIIEAGWTQKLVGQNEIDAMDGLAPAATVVDSNNGVSTKNSILGTANHNPGQATLTFFKNTAQQISYLPPVGTIIRATYRSGGASLARVQEPDSIATEAANWGDDGLRATTRRDLTPLPRTSVECELCAQALAGQYSYQHYTGTYSITTGSWLTVEPQSGQIVKFENLPANFPSAIQAEDITQVVSTFAGFASSTEYFDVVVTFGTIDLTSAALSGLRNINDVFTPEDTVESPEFINTNSVGLAFGPVVAPPDLTATALTTLTYTMASGPPSGGSYEVRYTDQSWGADDGKNLVGRFTSSSFTVPRNIRTRLIYVRAQDGRNLIPYSEDFTQWATNQCSATNVVFKNPGDNFAMVSEITPTGSTPYITKTAVVSANGSACATMSVLAPIGATYTVAIHIGGVITYSPTMNGTGHWQRVSVASSGSGTINISLQMTNGYTYYATWASIEAAAAETVYCKTKATSYGATSRFSGGTRVSYPLPPLVPGATIDYNVNGSVTAPLVNCIFPGDLSDVWGVEVRANDDTTVLYHEDLTLSGPGNLIQISVAVTPPLNSSRSLSYWVYMYNLFGEYSPGYNVTATIPAPTVTGLAVNDTTKTISWAGSNAEYYTLEIDATSSAFTHDVVNMNVGPTFSTPLADVLPDNLFFGSTWIRVTPVDNMGAGTAQTITHVYTPTGVTQFNGSEVVYVPAPPTPATTPTVPTPLTPYGGSIINQSYQNYTINSGINYLEGIS